jgi:protein-tyrosine phosphatase
VAGYVDIHSHILPGIDDGPPDLDSALETGRTASAGGTTTLAATPYLRADVPAAVVQELAGRCQGLREAIADAGIALQIVSDAEVSLA